MFFQKDAETMSRKQIEEIQLNRLKWLVDYCCKNIPFYHDRLEKAGVTAEKIKTLDDIQYIPYTTKDDIRDNYPFGLFGQPIKNIVRIHASSGTTALCVFITDLKKSEPQLSPHQAAILKNKLC